MGQIKIKRNQVAFNCSTMGDVSPVDYAAMVIVELFPALRTLKKDEDASVFPELISILDGVTVANKKHNYSKEALLSLVKEEFLNGKSVWDLLDIIGNNSFCFFPAEEGIPMHFTTVSQNPPPLRRDYGEESYKPKARPSDISEPIVDKPVKSERIRIDRPVTDTMPAKKDITSIPEIIALKKKYYESVNA